MLNDKHPTPNAVDWNLTYPQLEKWYSSLLGASIIKQVNYHLESLLRPIFGYQGLQLGTIGEQRFLEHAGLLRCFYLGANAEQKPVDLSGNVLDLPIASDTINLLAIPHTLEFCRDPHQLLREADRVLTHDGYLLLQGFNPLSSWGLMRSCRSWQNTPPWNGRFYAQARINDWLSLLNLHVVERRQFFMRPPFAHEGLLRRLAFMEKLQPWLGFVGGTYLILARKQSRPITPKRLRWQRQSVVARCIIRANNRAERRRDAQQQ